MIKILGYKEQPRQKPTIQLQTAICSTKHGVNLLKTIVLLAIAIKLILYINFFIDYK